MAEDTSLTRDRVEALRSELEARFASEPTYSHAILSILDELSDGWRRHQGLPLDAVERLNAALVAPLEALRSVEPARAKYSVDQFVLAWEKVSGSIEWLP